jgi:hypothetical protein
MAPCRSIMTTLYVFKSLNSLMEAFVILALIPLTRITNEEPAIHIPLYRGSFSYLPLSPRSKSSGKGTYYHLDYDVILLFGLTVRGYGRLEGGSRS